MKRIRFRPRTKRMMMVMVALLGLLVTLFFQQAMNISAKPSAQSEVDEVWRRAQEIGTYEYNTTILQTTWPTARLENVGLSSKQDQLYIEGQSNRAEDSMQMKLWSQGGSLRMGQNAVEIKVEDDKAFGRVGESEWEEVDDFTELFAPDNDHLTYLAGAKNVTNAGSDSRAGISFTRYTFDVDGLAFAEHMRNEMEEEMRRRGELPAAVNLDLIAQYVDMIGTGELWVDSEGLPLRQVMNVQFPAERGAMEWYEAKIETDFSNWADDPAANAFFGIPRMISQHDWQRTGLSFGMMGSVMALVSLMVLYQEKKKFYAAFALATIFAIVVGPLLQVHQVYAFSARQETRVVEHETAQAERQSEEERAAAVNQTHFNPNVSPLEQGQAKTVTQAILEDGSVTPEEQADAQKVLNAPVGENLADLRALTSTAAEDDPDNDGDGLTNGQEAFFTSNANQADSDGDGLNDGAEVYYLGTDPTDNDTDDDGINDGTEVRGFNFNNKQWYLDPIQPDTNKDGRLDTVECPNGTCADTDGDGTPNAFDFDDDNDGVPDQVDASATKVIGNLNSGLSNKTFNFNLSQFQSNKPLLVDVELRPTNAKHLWYTLNVLDWPSNDKAGQVQRVFDDAFGASGKEANGDLKMVPMLEIEVPYKYAHAANLPIKAGFNGTITQNTPLDAWLDQAKVEAYAMSVRKKDNNGNLLIYVPLNLVQDSVGDSPVAFAARIYYQPNSTDFGNTHQMRLVWLVQAKVDQCRAPEGAAENYCEDQNHWTSGESVIHTYYDDWFVTGLSVREEHGVKAGVAFENPNYAGRNPNYEKYLWALANGLQDSFLAGRRDVNVDEIKRRFDKDSNASVSEAQRWKIPQQALQVKTYNLTDQGQLAQLPMNHTKVILSQNFPSAAVGKIVNLLFTREERYRTTSLDGGTDVAQISGNSLTLSLNSNVVKQEVLATMNWAPYRHEGAGSWEPVDIQAYWDQLGDNFQNMYPYQGTQAQQNAGKVYLAKNYYLSLYQGSSALVEQAGTALNYSFKVDDTTIANGGSTEPFEVGVNDILGSIDLLRNGLTELRYAESTGVTGAALGTAGVSVLSYLAAFGVLELGNEQDAALGAVSAIISNLPDKVTSSKAGPLAAGMIVGIGVLATFGLKDAQSKVLEGVLKAVEIGMNVKAVVSAVRSGIDAAKSAVEAAKQVAKATSVTAVIGLVISVASSVGLFLYSAISGGLEFGSLAFNQALATLIATIIVAVIMFAIAAIPIVGQIIVAIIGLIDAIIIGICKLFGLDDSDNEIVSDYVCAGISGLLVKLVQFLIYSNQPLADLQAKDRMRPTNFSQNLVDPSKGFAAGNQMTFGMDVITNLFKNSPNSWMSWAYWHQFYDEHVRKSTFKYQLQTEKATIHESLSRGQTNWTPLDQGDKRGTIKQHLNQTLPLSQAGINIDATEEFYLAEGYAIPTQECFSIPIPIFFFILIPVCHLDQTKKDTLYVDLGDMVTFDVLPPSLDSFYTLTEKDADAGGYALAWDERFPVLMDADGDGLRSQAKGGNDPDDSKADTDGDGLSDFWEVEHAYNPTLSDADNDGFNDYWEAFHGTDPNQADSDDDRLTDKEEVDGWALAYDFVNGQALFSRVTSDPLQIDQDQDKLLDWVEREYKFSPAIPSNSNAVDIDSEITNQNQNAVAGYAKPGDILNYKAKVKNKLLARSVKIKQSQVRVSLSQSQTVYPIGLIHPQQSSNISQEITIDQNVGSQAIRLTSIAEGHSIPTDDMFNTVNDDLLWFSISHLNLDDKYGSSTFLNQVAGGFSPTVFAGVCVANQCPKAESDGKIAKAVTFDGQDDTITVDNNGSFVELNGFTIGLWINLPKNSSGRKRALINQQNNSNSGHNINLSLLPDNRITATVCGVDLTSTKAVREGFWTHIALQHNTQSSNRYTVLSLDGQYEAPVGFSSTCSSEKPIVIGAPSAHDPSATHFNGVMDEFFVNTRGWLDLVKSMYDYQQFGFRVIQDHLFTVDAEAPTVRLALDTNFVANQDKVMAIEASDLTSNVEKVEYRINNSSWQVAARTEEAWIFTYQPSGGPQQAIELRATDSAGNVGQSSKSFTVDGIGPSATINTTITQTPQPVSNDQVTLNGTVSDSGSGMAELYVELSNYAGLSLSGPLPATISGNNWQINYPVPAGSNGSYSLTVETTDQVGNVNLQALGTVQIDGTGSYADITMDNQTPIFGIGTNRPTIHGVVSEIPYPANSLLHLHFEEASGATTFIDGSTNHYLANCTADSCPERVNGQNGQALRFSNDSLMIEASDVAKTIGQLTNNFTVMAKMAVFNTSGTQQILSSGTTSSNNGFAFGVSGSGLHFTTHGVKSYNTTNVTLPSQLWRHVAAVMDNENNVTFYVNGIAVETISHNAPARANEDDSLFIGSQNGTSQFFGGLLDEVVVYKTQLSDEQIYAIANPVSSGVSTIEVGYLHAKDRDNPSLIEWEAASIAERNSVFSTWSHRPPEGIEGPHQIYLRTTDANGLQQEFVNRWNGEIDTQRPQMSTGSPIMVTDYNLDETSFNTPCGATNVIGSREYMNEPWYQSLFADLDQSDQKLVKITSSCDSPPQQTSEYTEITDYYLSGEAYGVAISGNYAYVAYGGKGLRVLDISSPDHPTEVGSFGLIYGEGVAVSGNYAYVHSNYSQRVAVFDVSTPSNPTEVARINKSNISDLAIHGNYAYITRRTGAPYSPGDLEVYDISTPSNPTFVKTVTIPQSGSNEIAISGNFAYVNGSDALYVFNVTIPSDPFLRTTFTGVSGYTKAITVSGNYAYLGGNSRFYIVDISSPHQPSVVGSYILYGISAIAISGAQAHIGTQDDRMRGNIRVLDISNPSSPALVTSYFSGWALFDIEVANNHIYAGTYRQLRIASMGGNSGYNACDGYGNCIEDTRQNEPSPVRVATPLNDEEASFFAWLDLPPTLLGHEPLTVTGIVQSDNYLKDLTLAVDESVIYDDSWDSQTVTQTILTVPWTPTGEDGERIFTLTVSDWLTGSATFTQTILLDTEAPQLSLAQNIFTDENYDVAGTVGLKGSVIDLVWISSVEASIDGVGELPEPDVEGKEWRISWRIGDTNDPPDGIDYTLHVTATDIVGRETVINEDITIDAAPPEPFTPTLSYQDSQAVTTVITTGMTIDDVSEPTLTVEWEASSDGSGVTGYLVEWIEHITDTETILASEVVSDGLSASFTAGEAQKLSVRVTARDGVGNEQPQSVGPFYVDYATTPSLVLWDEWAVPYRHWMDNACNLIGTDYRIDDNSNELAALSEQQDFYTTWNAEGLRLGWAGSDWNRDGDLFIYFDTKEGGTDRAFNPYPATITDTIVLLPARPEVELSQRSSLTARSLRQIATTNQMAADYMIWAQGSWSAMLMVWNGEEWRPSNEEWPNVFDELNNDWQYVFDANAERMTTDIFVPFEQLGISDPATASLSMVALASEDEGLNLWSTMPAGNNVNSERIVETDSEGIQRFILTKRYEWPSLADGICPSGVAPVANSRALQRTGDALQFTGADVRAAISTTPDGIGYSILGDNLTGAQDKLFANLTDWNALQSELCLVNPDDESCQREPESDTASNIDFNAAVGLADKTNVTHDLLGDKEDVTYTIRLFNRGSQPANGVVVDVATWGPVTLPEGEYREDDFGQFYTQEIAVGTIEAGESVTVTFPGQTDFTFDPDNNEGWATIDVIVYDESGSLDANQIDWLYVDHEIDRVAPDYIEIQSPVGIIGSGENTISGFVFDQSTVPTLTMEVEDPTGEVSSITCLDETASDKQWACTFDAGDANEGDILKVRLKATDIHGQESDWFDWQSFIVDGTAPTISLDSASQSLLNDKLIGGNESSLMGQLADNRLVSGVEVCTADELCEAANIVIDAQTMPTTTYIYDDEPAEAIAIGAGTVCESGNELVRTIMVTDSFTIADLDVGLNLDHSYRNDVDVYLKSPAGTEAKLISYNPAAENLDVLLDDASATLARFDKEEHNTAAPYYENQRGAYNLLKRFNGEDAAGNWELTICDYYAEADDGAYNRSRLIFTAEAEVENTSASWQVDISMTNEMAHEEQALTIYALDSVGNRSSTPLALSFTIDNVAPVITPTLMPTELGETQEVTFAGQVSDESGIQNVQLTILAPNGDLYSAEVYPNIPEGFPFVREEEEERPELTEQLFLPLITGGNSPTDVSWTYTDTEHFNQAGTYTIWIEAEDSAGNRHVTDPYQLGGIGKLYLPLINN